MTVISDRKNILADLINRYQNRVDFLLIRLEASESTDITLRKERVETLIEEGVTGADLIIACIGAGLKAYTQFDRVELPNGDELDAQTFLDEVQKTVLDAVLTDVLHCDKRLKMPL